MNAIIPAPALLRYRDDGMIEIGNSEASAVALRRCLPSSVSPLALWNGSADADANARMKRAIPERFPPVILDVRAEVLHPSSVEI